MLQGVPAIGSQEYNGWPRRNQSSVTAPRLTTSARETLQVTSRVSRLRGLVRSLDGAVQDLPGKNGASAIAREGWVWSRLVSRARTRCWATVSWRFNLWFSESQGAGAGPRSSTVRSNSVCRKPNGDPSRRRVKRMFLGPGATSRRRCSHLYRLDEARRDDAPRPRRGGHSPRAPRVPPERGRRPRGLTDHRSTDGAVNSLQLLRRRTVSCSVREDGEFAQQAVWQTRMARLAVTDHRADWIISSDADEFGGRAARH